MSMIYTFIGSISCVYGFYMTIKHIFIYKQKSDYKSRFPVVFSNLPNTADTDRPMLPRLNGFQDMLMLQMVLSLRDQAHHQY